MISFWRIFWLEFVSLGRSWTLALLTIASAGWMVALPHLVKGDGTAEGARELYIHFSLGGVFLLLVVALLATATGTLAREREAGRLQLTLVRPVSLWIVALGKVAALVSAGALVLAMAGAILAATTDLGRPCNHVLSPILISPREEARAMYELYMADTNTPQAVRAADKSAVLRLLEAKALDHYQAIEAGAFARWRFPTEGMNAAGGRVAVQLRLTNAMDLRADVVGDFRIGTHVGSVSNLTKSVVDVPLVGAGKLGAELEFVNRGSESVMLRPRRDIKLLVEADAFGRNLLRAYVALVAILAFLVALGVALSAGLGRPVAMFVAFVVLAVGEMSPSVVEQYPNELDASAKDRLGLAITRAASAVTSPISSLSPLEALAKDECIEIARLGETVLVDLLAAPLLFTILSALILTRKKEVLC